MSEQETNTEEAEGQQGAEGTEDNQRQDDPEEPGPELAVARFRPVGDHAHQGIIEGVPETRHQEHCPNSRCGYAKHIRVEIHQELGKGAVEQA